MSLNRTSMNCGIYTYQIHVSTVSRLYIPSPFIKRSIFFPFLPLFWELKNKKPQYLRVPLGLCFFTLFVSFFLFNVSCFPNDEISTGTGLESLAVEIDKSIICPVCPSETIDQSQVEIAKQMRTIVRQRLALGESKKQVLKFFVERYGPSVLAEPPKTGFNLVAWLIPPLIFIVGSTILALVIKSMTQSHKILNENDQGVNADDLDKYLSKVDSSIDHLNRYAMPEKTD